MKVKIDELSAAVELELDGYADDVRDAVGEAVKRAANLCVKTLRQTSPKKTGRYAKGWTKKLSKPPEEPAAIVYNKDRGWLAHLLENGHAKAGGGRVEGRPHIRPAADAAQQQLMEDVAKLIEEV